MLDSLADETILEVFGETAYQDQARLAQTNKKFNQIVNDHSLRLFKHKTEDRYQIGNVCLFIKETKNVTEHENNDVYRFKEQFIKTYPYTLFYTQNRLEPIFVQMISKQNKDSLVNAIKEGASSLIKELRSKRIFAVSNLAYLLQQALNYKNLQEEFKAHCL